jgi:hypothetical protein
MQTLLSVYIKTSEIEVILFVLQRQGKTYQFNILWFLSDKYYLCLLSSNLALWKTCLVACQTGLSQAAHQCCALAQVTCLICIQQTT